MKKTNKHIEIVITSLKGFNSMSPKSREMLLKVLQKNYRKVGISTVNSILDLEELVEKNPDLAFIGVKKVPFSELILDGEFVWVKEYLEESGIVTTGSANPAIKLEQDKSKAKDVVLEAGLATSQYFVAKEGQYSDESQLPLGFPLFIKPPDRGAGVGVDDKSVVRNFSEFEAKVKSLQNDLGSESLVEKYLPGREFTVAVLLDSNRENLMVMPIEQLPDKNSRGDHVIGQKMKSSSKETEVGLIEEGDIKTAVIELAREVFIALGARDYGRIDIRLDENDTPHFLEANLIPGLIEGSGNFPKACQLVGGINYEQMILRIVNLAFARDDKRLQLASSAAALSALYGSLEPIKI